MDKKMRILCEVCLGDKNIDKLINEIRSNIRLKEASVPKCRSMITNIMEKNLEKLSRPPRSREEIEKLYFYLNTQCVNNIIEIIAKKYPNLHVNKKRMLVKNK